MCTTKSSWSIAFTLLDPTCEGFFLRPQATFVELYSPTSVSARNIAMKSHSVAAAQVHHCSHVVHLYECGAIKNRTNLESHESRTSEEQQIMRELRSEVVRMQESVVPPNLTEILRQGLKGKRQIFSKS